MIKLGGFSNPENFHSRHAEAMLFNPEHDIKKLNLGKDVNSQGTTDENNMQFGKVGTCELHCCGPYEILGRSMVPVQVSQESSWEHLDCNSLFSDDEINDILKTAGSPENLPCGIYTKFKEKPEYDLYIFNGDRLVINNKSRTNDTTVIFKDGRALHIGSYHNVEIAPKGKCVGIVEEAKKRYINQ